MHLYIGCRIRCIGHCPHLWNPPLQPIHHSKAIACDTSRVTINVFAVQAEMAVVETSIDVGNSLWIFYECLWMYADTVLGLYAYEPQKCFDFFLPFTLCYGLPEPFMEPTQGRFHLLPLLCLAQAVLRPP